MSLVVFPFKHEDPTVIRRNLEVASGHDAIETVWAVAAADGAALEQVGAIGDAVADSSGRPVSVFPQERIGALRPGKGDGMNTALARAAAEGFERIHFYDADITNFDDSWIDGAEDAADAGYEIVRHRFPRAATDAMITWMITRPALAMIFPSTILPRLGQPLGGELLISGRVARALAHDGLVRNRSDWGIDTVITYATAAMGAPMYEHNVPAGKRHALYGSLEEIRDMVIECLDAVGSLVGKPAPPAEATFGSDPAAPVPEDLKSVVGYDVEATTALLVAGWTADEVELAGKIPGGIAPEVLENRTAPNFEFMDSPTWEAVLPWLLEHFHLGDQAWKALAFRLWLMRVLSYTSKVVPRGYDRAISYLDGTIRRYEARPVIG